MFKPTLIASVMMASLMFVFQNCGRFASLEQSSTSLIAGTSYCDKNSNDTACAAPAAATCTFNGQTIPEGGSTKAFLASTVATGASCQGQTRVCTNGVLSGSYAFASCAPGADAACLFNGLTIASGASTTAYRASSVAFGSTCATESRSCAAGTLTGSFAFASCQVAAPAACLFNGQTVAHGSAVQAFAAASVPAGQACVAQTRTCFNGLLSGAGEFASCAAAAAPAACLFNGQTIANGGTVSAFLSSTVPAGQTCTAEIRSCANGVLSGSAGYATCTAGAGASCVLNGATIPHGGTANAYTSAVSDAAGNCTAETRVCTNGVLSGSATAASCVKLGVAGSVAWGMDGCNETTFFQDIDDPTLFFGRWHRYRGLPGESAADCSTWQTMNPALFRADFTNHYLRKLDDMYSGDPVTTEGRQITTGYDPTVARVNGTKYVTFECAGPKFPGSVANCGAPLDQSNHVVTSGLRIFVDGVAATPMPYVPSASTPKLLAYGGQYFLAWAQVLLLPPAYSWVQLGSRAAYFTPTMPMLTSDSAQAFNIYNPPSTGVADVQHLQPINGTLYFSGARGDAGCRAPLDRVPGCYHLEIGAVTSLAANGALDDVPAPPITLPDNPQEYVRYVYDPNRGWGLLGMFLDKWDGMTARTVPTGLRWLPLSNMSTMPVFPVKQVTPTAATCDPATQPSPAFGARDGVCRQSCGNIGGTRGFTTSCASNGMRDVGIAYDAPYCCAPNATTCDPATQPAPNYGVKNGQCLPSCGGLGGTAAYPDSCAAHGLSDRGPAYDVVACCG